MAAVLTRMFSHGNRLLRHSTSSNQTNTRSPNTRALVSNADADVNMAGANNDDDEEEEDEEEEVEEEDPDAEGSPDVEDYPTQEQQAQDEGAAEDDDYEEEDDRRTIKVRRRSGRNSGRLRKKGSESAEEEDAESPESPDSDKDSEDEDESEAAPWEGESEGEEEEVAEVEVANPNRCVFCDQDEEHDPSDEFEEYLACAVCGDNAHRSCAREEQSLRTDEDAAQWRCPACVENGLEADDATSDHERPRRRRSSSKLTRELAPVTKPGGHTIFANAIIDDEADGSRALRKRKASSESADDKPTLMTRKRRRREVSEAPGDSILEPIDENGEEASGRARPSRLRQSRKSTGPPFRVVEKNEDQFIVSIAYRVNWSELEHEWKKARRRARDKARRERQAQVVVLPEPDIPHFPGISLNFTAPLFTLQEKEGEEAKKPYGGILSEVEADTTRTFPQPGDRKKFEDARQKAEEEWKKKLEAARQADPAKPNAKVSGPPSRIKCINFGKFEVDTWHAAPYPEEYSRNKVLYICEFCLKYMSSDFVAWRHKLKCPAKHPPGDEIYRDGNFSFFEVDGRKNPVYCQNLCLLAKLFLGSKTLYYDVEPFLFYVMTEHDEYGEHFVGYFSKEKRPSSMNNVSCILVLPVHQRRGFGHMLIEFSYLLTKVEQKTGSPEKPLSDMGLVSYRSYWRLVLCKELLALHASNTPLSITELSSRTGMTTDDIVCALEGLRALVRDPITKSYALRLDMAYYKQYIENYEKKGYTKINAESLIWVPYVMGRDNMHYENAPQLTTVKQREEPDETAAAFEEVGPLEEGIQQSQGFEEAEASAVAVAEDTVEAAADPTGGAALDDGFPIDPALLALDTSMVETADSNIPIDPALLDENANVDEEAQPNASTNDVEHTVHLFPPISLTTPSKPRSPPKHLLPATPLIANTFGHPNNDNNNNDLNGDASASTSTASPIPPTRYEVFPVIPGMQNKRKPGRPLGRGARHRLAAGTPSRRGSPGVSLNGTPLRSQSGAGVQPTPGSATMRRTRSNLNAAGTASGGGSARPLRRTRSQLHEAMALDGAADHADDDGEDEEMHEEMEEDAERDREVDEEEVDAGEDGIGEADEEAQPDGDDEEDDPDAEGEEDVEMQE